MPPKKATNGGSGRQRKRGKSTKDSAPVDFETLEQTRNEGRAQWSLSANTTLAYKGQLKRARLWLATHVKTRQQAVTEGHKQPNWRELDLDDLEKAFDDVPNKYSAYALEMLLTEKCLHEGKSVSTAQSVYSAIKNHWENR